MGKLREWVAKNYKKTWFILTSAMLLTLGSYVYEKFNKVYNVLSYKCEAFSLDYNRFEGAAGDRLDTNLIIAILNYTGQRFGTLSNDTLAKASYEYNTICKVRPNYSLLDIKTMIEEVKTMPNEADLFGKFDTLYLQKDFRVPAKNQAIANYIAINADISN